MNQKQLDELREVAERRVYKVGINNATYILHSDKPYRCPFHNVWQRMMDRCYGSAALKNKANYKSVEVCDDWKVFMNFRSWMMFQDWHGKTLDKDLFGDGTLYSPETCRFISMEENKVLVHINEPAQAAFKKNKGFYAQTYHKGKQMYLGMHRTKRDARIASAKKRSEILLDYATQTDHEDISGMIAQKAVAHIISAHRSTGELR